MAKKKAVPTISKLEFDRIEPVLREGLRKWWEDEAQSFDAAVSETASVWEGMPEIDSKAVVKASPLIRQHLGCDLDPKLIKKGGYSSLDDLADDLLPKIRATCPDRPPTKPSTTASRLESINVRRS